MTQKKLIPNANHQGMKLVSGGKKPDHPSRQWAINQMCRDCIYDDEEVGTWRQQVEACTIKRCPLWEFRPKTKIKKQDSNR